MLESFLTAMMWGFGLLIPFIIGCVFFVPLFIIVAVAILRTITQEDEDNEE